jgi:hypothetical protein
LRFQNRNLKHSKITIWFKNANYFFKNALPNRPWEYSMKKFVDLTHLINWFYKRDLRILYKHAKILSTSNMRLFLNTIFSRVGRYFSWSCHEVSSTGLIHPMVGSNTIKKFVSLIHLIKQILQERIVHSL